MKIKDSYDSLNGITDQIRSQLSPTGGATGIDAVEELEKILQEELEKSLGFHSGEIRDEGIFNSQGELLVSIKKINGPFLDYRGPILWKAQYYWERDAKGINVSIIYHGPDFKRIK